MQPNSEFIAETVTEDDIINIINATPNAVSPQNGDTPQYQPQDDTINNDLNTFANPQQNGQQMTTQPPNIMNFLSPELCVNIFDGLATKVGLLVGKQIGMKVNKSDIAASAAEKKLLEQPMDGMLKAANITVTNPYEAFLYAALGIYGGKLLLFYLLAETPEQEEEDITDLNQLAAAKPKKGRGRPRKNS